MVSAFWVWSLSYLTMFITQARQKYKDLIALQKQKDRCKKLMSHTESKEGNEETQPSVRIDEDDQNNQQFPKPRLILVDEAPNGDQNNPNIENAAPPSEVDNINPQPIIQEAPKNNLQINNQAANPEVYTIKFVFLSFIIMWLVNFPIWLLYFFYSESFSELFLFIQLNLLPHLTSSLLIPPITVMIDKKRRNFCQEVITDIFTTN